ncbi:MAG: ABC transporter permease, partial [Nitrospinota bacterium]
NSLSGAAAAATLAVAAAFPIAYLRVREPRPLHNFFLRASYAGYVLPGPIVALGVIFFMLHLFPPFYGTVAALVLAYVVRFLPQCLQAEEASLEQVSPSIEEAGRSCGAPFGRVLRKVTLPLIAPGLLTGWVLVFVHAMRELPATLLLRPVGFDTLAVRIWIETSEEFYSMASPGALMLILVTLPLLALVLSRGAGSLGVRRPA